MPFGKVAAQEVTQKPVRLTLNQLSGQPWLEVVHLGETNVEFWADALAQAGTRAAQGGHQALTPAQVAEARLKNRDSVARYAVRGLGGFRHDDGREATMADIAELVGSLPASVFDSVLAFVMNPENFRERPQGDPKEIAGKS